MMSFISVRWAVVLLSMIILVSLQVLLLQFFAGAGERTKELTLRNYVSTLVKLNLVDLETRLDDLSLRVGMILAAMDSNQGGRSPATITPAVPMGKATTLDPKIIEFLPKLTESVKELELELYMLKAEVKTRLDVNYTSNPIGLDLRSVWRNRALQIALERMRVNYRGEGLLDVYEFGVFTGSSMIDMINYLLDEEDYRCHLWGFDSFVGLPREDSPGNADWKETLFSAMAGVEGSSPSQAKDVVLKYIKHASDYDNVTLITGFFSTSLNPWVLKAHPFRKALYVDIDTDLYTGAIQALEWMFGNDMIIPNVTVVGYDDLLYSTKAKTFEDGEARAHREISEKYGVKFTYMPPINQGIIFTVDGIGVSDHTPGTGYF